MKLVILKELEYEKKIESLLSSSDIEEMRKRLIVFEGNKVESHVKIVTRKLKSKLKNWKLPRNI